MYLQGVFEERRVDVLHAHMRAHPLATLAVAIDGAVVVNHMPVLLAPGGGHGTLHGHLPRENPVSRALDGQTELVAVFHGPESYISPSWYPSKHEHGRAVPTWNYAVVHARGSPRIVDDAAWLLEHLTRLTIEHESRRAVPWKVTDAPAEFTERMISRLVGFEMPIVSLMGKWKVSQNRPEGDRRGVVAALECQGDDASLAMAELVAATTGPTTRPES